MNKTATQNADTARPAVRSADWLGAGGFVFLDERPWPYMVRKTQSGDWWLHYWSHGYKNFATMRKLSPEEVERFRPLALPEEQAGLYAPNGPGEPSFPATER